MKKPLDVLDGLAEASLQEGQSKQDWVDYLSELIDEAKMMREGAQEEIDGE